MTLPLTFLKTTDFPRNTEHFIVGLLITIVLLGVCCEVLTPYFVVSFEHSEKPIRQRRYVIALYLQNNPIAHLFDERPDLYIRGSVFEPGLRKIQIGYSSFSLNAFIHEVIY